MESKIIYKIFVTEQMEQLHFWLLLLPMDVSDTSHCIQTRDELQEMHPLLLESVTTYTLEYIVFLHCLAYPQYRHHTGYGSATTDI